MAELLVNNARTTLVGTINSAVTSLVVNDPSAFPATGNFRIVIDSEIMLVTGVSTDTFTVTRGSESSSAASHSSGVSVAQVLTNAGLDQYIKDRTTLKGTYGSRPAASKAGLVYLPTDEDYLYRDTGAAWNAFGPVYPMTPPVNGDFSWVNQGSASVTVNGESIWLEDPANAGLAVRIRTKTAPATPYIVDTFIKPLTIQVSAGFGVGFRESGSGKLHTLLFQVETASPLNYFRLYTAKWNTASSFNASYGDAPWPMIPNFLRMADNGTNRSLAVSVDGFHYIVVHSLSRTDFLTPDEIFFFVYSQNAANNAGVHLLSWYEH